jgi:DNA-binding transcriptional regulator/RsmH inhibitor MraZ
MRLRRVSGQTSFAAVLMEIWQKEKWTKSLKTTRNNNGEHRADAAMQITW